MHLLPMHPRVARRAKGSVAVKDRSALSILRFLDVVDVIGGKSGMDRKAIEFWRRSSRAVQRSRRIFIREYLFAQFARIARECIRFADSFKILKVGRRSAVSSL